MLCLGLLLICSPPSAGAAPARPKSRSAQCEVRSAGAPPWRGRCLFVTSGGASFSISPAGRAGFPGGVSLIDVAVTGRGVAQVSGLTRAGIHSRWGEARRSARDAACWDGSDFRICAR